MSSVPKQPDRAAYVAQSVKNGRQLTLRFSFNRRVMDSKHTLRPSDSPYSYSHTHSSLARDNTSLPYTTPLSTAPPFRQAKKKEDHQKWTTSLVNNSAKMRDMCKMSHLTIANNYLYWNLGLLISRPDRVVRWWDRFHHDRFILSLPFRYGFSNS
ncbi:Uncharacterized protein HZ326_24566 [Fusarium oxysporum f. sp. albedinis]|nr:Uncharacterized protein HZ326_24566 [Fusarium oxysporum f. sp. albedinis]